PKLELEWRQFLDADVLSAVAERATVTTLANVEGRTLTEITLTVRNHAQPFMKVVLPTDAQLLSAEVENERVKPVGGSDGSRVPLLRAGLDSSRAYTVSFVYLSSGSRFGKNGTYDMGLPKLDIPVNLLMWEVSLPDRLEVKQFGGNAFAAEEFPAAAQNYLIDGLDNNDLESNNIWSRKDLSELQSGEIGGIIADMNGAVIPNSEVTATNTQTGATLSTTADSDGHWVISGMQPGAVRVSISAPGFKTKQIDLQFQASRPAKMGVTMEVAGVTETVTVTDSLKELEKEGDRLESLYKAGRGFVLNKPSDNVFNLQRRVAGILPVRIEVPRSGKSYRFVRPLVLDEETRISFQYKTR
ncbi:MAG TPA: carboxypeptidase-like regulatory domain-containing protein, partial [Pyrinomonadaceae bacterium]|nr:carboxypeptidase-like regulatory domain-containing protein [Pyrinomonadaceae bacterium]